jgi:Glycosyltransferase family 87
LNLEIDVCASRMSRDYKFGLPIAALLAASMWFYVDHVYLGHQLAEAAANDNPQGIFSDFYPRWLGTREMLLHHRNPYSFEVARDIQIGYYGRPLDPNRPGDPKDQAAFAYPVFVVFLLAPTIGLPFSAVQVGFRWFLVLLTAATVPLWLRALRWQASPAVTATLVILALGNFPLAQGIKLQQLTLLVSGMIAGSAVLLVAGHLLLAGILLALATIKPQIVLLLAAWLLLWAASNYHDRRRFIWGFGLTMAALLAGAEFVMPGWIPQFVKALVAYREYLNKPKSVLFVLTTPAWGLVFSAVILIAIALVCWRMRHAPADTPIFGLVSSAVLAVTVVTIPMTALYNQVLLLPAVLLVVRYRRSIWTKHHLLRITCVISGLLVLWPWLATVALTVASFFVPAEPVQDAWAVPLWTSLAVPLGVLVPFVSVLSEFTRAGMDNQSRFSSDRTESAAT